MLDAFLTGLGLVFEWPTIGFLFGGVLLGIWLGAVPGLGGIIGLVILLPFTFGMEATQAFALLLGMFAVTSTSDTIASVMLGIPGTAASQATILDGYPLAQKGEAHRAFGAAFTVSAFGGVFGALILAASLPLLLPLIKSFGKPEIFALGILGLSMIGVLSGKSIAKGLVVALLGLLIAMVGFAESDAIPRYDFGTEYLLDGIPLIPVVLGLFAIPELMDLALKDTSISRVPRDRVAGVTILTGAKDALKHWWLATRSAFIGTYIGVLPGLGGAIVDWLAYAHAVQSAKDKSQFGKGDIRGVIAPESANNAVKAGALIPTVAFGIPGSLGAAILLGALLIQGLRPGPEMLTTDAHITFSMVWSIVVANVLAAALLMLWANQLAKLAFVRGHLIVPAVIMFVFMGAWIARVSIGDWIVCLAFGVLGFAMKKGGWPRPPIILALILGDILENALHISVLAHGGYGWLERPVVLVVLALTAIMIVLAGRGIIKAKSSPNRAETGDDADGSNILSLPLSIVLVLLFASAIWIADGFPVDIQRLPMMIAVPALLLSIYVLGKDIKLVREDAAGGGGIGAVWGDAVAGALLGRAGVFFAYLIAMIAASFVIGQIAAICLYIAIYLWRWGGYGWRLSTGYALAGGVFLWGFYGKVMTIHWLPSYLDDFYGVILGLGS